MPAQTNWASARTGAGQGLRAEPARPARRRKRAGRARGDPPSAEGEPRPPRRCRSARRPCSEATPSRRRTSSPSRGKTIRSPSMSTRAREGELSFGGLIASVWHTAASWTKRSSSGARASERPRWPRRAAAFRPRRFGELRLGEVCHAGDVLTYRTTAVDKRPSASRPNGPSRQPQHRATTRWASCLHESKGAGSCRATGALVFSSQTSSTPRCERSEPRSTHCTGLGAPARAGVRSFAGSALRPPHLRDEEARRTCATRPSRSPANFAATRFISASSSRTGFSPAASSARYCRREVLDLGRRWCGAVERRAERDDAVIGEQHRLAALERRDRIVGEFLRAEGGVVGAAHIRRRRRARSCSGRPECRGACRTAPWRRAMRVHDRLRIRPRLVDRGMERPFGGGLAAPRPATVPSSDELIRSLGLRLGIGQARRA